MRKRIFMLLRLFTIALVVALSVEGGECFAQTLPPAVEPGRYDKEFYPKNLPELRQPPAPEKVVEKPEPAEDALPFFLSAVIVEGTTLYTPKDLVPLYEDMLADKITFADLQYIADLITAKYRNDGYVLSKVVIPPQEAEDGIVRFRVVEGKIEKVLSSEEEMKLEGLMDKYAAKISKQHVTNTKELERYLLLMNDLPGVEVKGTLFPSQMAGASNVHIKAKEDKFAAKVTLDNWGTRYLGPIQASVYAVGNNLTGNNEETAIRVVKSARSSDLRYVEVTEKVPLGTEGTTLEGRFRYSRSNPGSDLRDLEIKSRSSNAAIKIKHPIIRTRTKNLYTWATLEHQQSRVTSFGSKLSEDRIRLARLGMLFDWVDGYKGANLVSLEGSYGLDVLGASGEGEPSLSRIRGAGVDFFKTTVDMARLQKLTENINFLAYLSGQFSSHALLAAEEFGFGGPSFGRGYDPSEITGDHGFALKLEAQYNDDSDWSWLKNYQVFVFYDFGMVFNKDHRVEEPLEKSAASAGFGIRGYLENDITGSIELAKPLTRTVLSQGENQKNPTVYVRVGADF
jgi:hemolysin activation/secretion protein